MERSLWLSEQQVAGFLPIISGLVFFVGGMLYAGRAFLNWPGSQTSTYLILERGFVMAAVLLNVLALLMLESLLRAAGDTIVARLALATYAVGAIVVIVAETASLSTRESPYAQVVAYVVLAFLSQAAFGVSLLLTGLLPGWVGWATIAWNLAWLVILPIFSPRDIYFPVLHHVAPFLIGVMLLLKR